MRHGLVAGSSASRQARQWCFPVRAVVAPSTCRVELAAPHRQAGHEDTRWLLRLDAHCRDPPSAAAFDGPASFSAGLSARNKIGEIPCSGEAGQQAGERPLQALSLSRSTGRWAGLPPRAYPCSRWTLQCKEPCKWLCYHERQCMILLLQALCHCKADII